MPVLSGRGHLSCSLPQIELTGQRNELCQGPPGERLDTDKSFLATLRQHSAVDNWHNIVDAVVGIGDTAGLQIENPADPTDLEPLNPQPWFTKDWISFQCLSTLSAN
jgi:hypothetical protein